MATALVINWQLGLVMLACVPFIGASVAILSKLMSSSTQKGTDHYEKAGGVATEVCMYVLIAPSSHPGNNKQQTQHCTPRIGRNPASKHQIQPEYGE